MADLARDGAPTGDRGRDGALAGDCGRDGAPTAEAPRLICDLDGTLTDSAPSLCAAGNAVLAALGRAPVDVATYVGFIGKGQRVQVERLLRHTGGIPGDDVGPWLARFRAAYDPLSLTMAYPGAVSALAILRAEGWRVAICTQKPEAQARRLLLGLGFAVDGVVGGDTVGPEVLKPDPRVLAAAAEPLGTGPAVYVGDGETDAETAHGAGMPFLLHLGGYRHGPVAAMRPTAVFDDFADLPRLARAAAGLAPA